MDIDTNACLKGTLIAIITQPHFPHHHAALTNGETAVVSLLCPFSVNLSLERGICLPQEYIDIQGGEQFIIISEKFNKSSNKKLF
jgi:hypothetical protein